MWGRGAVSRDLGLGLEFDTWQLIVLANQGNASVGYGRVSDIKSSLSILLM